MFALSVIPQNLWTKNVDTCLRFPAEIRTLFKCMPPGEKIETTDGRGQINLWD